MSIRREVQDALAEVYSGAGSIEREALLSALIDRGLVIVRAADLGGHSADDYDGDDEDVI